MYSSTSLQPPFSLSAPQYCDARNAMYCSTLLQPPFKLSAPHNVLQYLITASLHSVSTTQYTAVTHYSLPSICQHHNTVMQKNAMYCSTSLQPPFSLSAPHNVMKYLITATLHSVSTTQCTAVPHHSLPSLCQHHTMHCSTSLQPPSLCQHHKIYSSTLLQPPFTLSAPHNVLQYLI
jgi:hypothetical protein